MLRRLKRSPLSKIYIALVLVGATLSFGTIGYMLIENYNFIEALYMTVITLATVGFQEVHPLSEAGRVFTTIVILFNLGIFAYVITQISRYFMDGDFVRTYRIYKMRNTIDKLEGHTIVCGLGRNGQEAVRLLERNREPFVVIELSDDVLQEKRTPGLLYIQGDATRDEVLLEAGIQRAKALISALADDALNVFVILTARNLNPKVTLISRASENTSVKKLKNAGADNVIMPDKIGGAHMAMLVINRDIEEFVDLMATRSSDEFQISELDVHQSISLREFNCWLRTGATLLGYKDNGNEFQLNPSPDTTLVPGSRVIVMGSKLQIVKLRKELEG